MHRNAAFSQISSVTCRRRQPQRKTWKFAIWLSFALLPFNVHVIASFQSCCRFFPRFCIQLLLLALSTSPNIIFFRNYTHEMYKYEKIRPIVMWWLVPREVRKMEHARLGVMQSRVLFIYFLIWGWLVSVCTEQSCLLDARKCIRQLLSFHYLLLKSNWWRWSRLYLDWKWFP